MPSAYIPMPIPTKPSTDNWFTRYTEFAKNSAAKYGGTPTFGQPNTVNMPRYLDPMLQFNAGTTGQAQPPAQLNMGNYNPMAGLPSYNLDNPTKSDYQFNFAQQQQQQQQQQVLQQPSQSMIASPTAPVTAASVNADTQVSVPAANFDMGMFDQPMNLGLGSNGTQTDPMDAAVQAASLTGANNAIDDKSFFQQANDFIGSDAFSNTLNLGKGLAGVWMGLKNLDFAEEQFDFEKSAYSQNYMDQKALIDEQRQARKRTLDSWSK